MLSIFTNQRVCLEFIWTVYMYIYILEFARLSNFQGLSSVVLVWTRADTIECKLKSYRNSNSMYIHYAYGLAFILKYFKCVLGVIPYECKDNNSGEEGLKWYDPKNKVCNEKHSETVFNKCQPVRHNRINKH